MVCLFQSDFSKAVLRNDKEKFLFYLYFFFWEWYYHSSSLHYYYTIILYFSTPAYADVVIKCFLEAQHFFLNVDLTEAYESYWSACQMRASEAH